MTQRRRGRPTAGVHTAAQPRDPNAHRSPDRNRWKQDKFRRAVLTRDRYTCQHCGHRDPTGRTLEAHHLQPGYDPSNGITLCGTQANGCHRALDPHAR